MKKWKIAGINFDHMHMGDLLRMAHAHPRAEIVGICDERPERMAAAAKRFSIPPDRVFTDYRACIEKTKPDVVILCPATAEHAMWTERIAPLGAHVLMEKPFAASLRDADRMIAAMRTPGRQLAINWPLRWYPSHVTAKKVIDAGTIGDVTEVHFYDGNRGPLRHVADKVVVPEAIANAQKAESWWYRKAAGGGSLLDYLGYGTTLGTWYLGGRAPVEVCAMVDEPPGLEVDEHAIVIARYDTGLSKFETRWGTFTDPWLKQPQPKCGFVIVGTKGTVSSYDLEPTIRVQTRRHEAGRVVPVLKLRPPFQNPVQYFLHALETGTPVDGPLAPAIARIGQQIVDTAVKSARLKRAVRLLP